MAKKDYRPKKTLSFKIGPFSFLFVVRVNAGRVREYIYKRNSAARYFDARPLPKPAFPRVSFLNKGVQS